ncbi:AsmA family protein [Labrys okinawensis]|uniref:AsmA family protein n=1 Tax=Labrys okinawensis TaxID=346911 RepID=UPI0039BCCC97
MREALTVVGFLLILAFAALFTAPLYMDWNAWRDDIGARLSEHFGTPVIIKGAIQARLLPQPWLSLGDVSIGDPYGSTKLKVAGIDGDVSLGGLLRGDIELSNVVVRSPELTIIADDRGLVAPLSQNSVSLDAAVESFELNDGSLHYINKADGQNITLSGINLVGEGGSVFGPYKAEGGVQFAGVPHTVKLATGTADKSGLHLRLTIVPADKPVTLDLDGEIKLADGKPTFVGNAMLMRPLVATKGNGGDTSADASGENQTPWSVSGPVAASPAGLISDKVAVQIGPDESSLKLGGTLNISFGTRTVLDSTLSGKQLQLDRFAGIGPDQRLPPAAVLTRLVKAMPSFADLSASSHLDLSVQGLMLGSELMSNARVSLRMNDGKLQVDRLEADLPGQSHLLLAGDVNDDGGGFKGNLSLNSNRATGLIGWLQGQPVLGRPDAAKKLTLQANLTADADKVGLSQLTLAVDDAAVKGELAWSRLAHGRAAGRVEANLAAQRIDLDALPSVAALLPGSGDIFSEADIRLQAQELALAGIEAKSVSGHIKAGGKLIALEDVVVNDLGGANLTANGHIDNIGVLPQGEIRVSLNGRDLTGLAATLKRSALPPFWVNAFADRAPSLSPANGNLVIAFGNSERYSVDGKFGGSVIQLDTDLGSRSRQSAIAVKLKADSLDVATLLRQAGLALAVANIPGRAALDLNLSGVPGGAMSWTAAFKGVGLDIGGKGQMTGSFEAPAFDGQITAGTDDILAPARLFGVALPGVMPAQGVTLSSGMHMRAGRFAFDNLFGTLLGMPVSGSLTVNPGKPLRLDGQLSFAEADGQVLGSLLAGADLGAGNASGNAFSDEAFGPTALDNLAGHLSVSAQALQLSHRLPDLSDAKGEVSFGPRSVAIDNFTASIGGGTVTGALQLSRAALDTAVTGRFSLQNVDLRTPDVSGRLNAGLDFQGTGRSADGLMSSLTGGGTLELKEPVLSGLSENAFNETVSAVDGGLANDPSHVKPAFMRSLAGEALNVSPITGNVSLAGGILRLSSTRTASANSTVTLSGLLDLSDLTVKSDVALMPADIADGFGGPSPSIPVQIRGAIDNLQRDVDVSSLIAWLSIRGAEQQARKLEQLEAQRQAEEKAADEARRAEAAQMQKAIDAARLKVLLQSPGPAGPPKDQLPPAAVGPAPAPVPQIGGRGAPIMKMPSLNSLPATPVVPAPTTVMPAPSVPSAGPQSPGTPAQPAAQ